MRKYYLAIDIGASSGRHIVGWMDDGELKTKEVYRFPNGIKPADGHLIWDIESLLAQVKTGIKNALVEFGSIKSLSIDTWGVDYVLMQEDLEVFPCFAYRDSRTEAIIDEVHQKIPFSELYQRTGCQFQPFNSIYQLYDDQQKGRLYDVTDFLMIPEYLLYKLCGTKAKEYTNATTTGMVNAQSGNFDLDIVRKMDLPEHLFPTLLQPGTVIGTTEEGIQCVLCATHDTGSAVEGISMEDNALYISSGTWSLLGTKTPIPLTDKDSEHANYSNEGGVGYNRYQKNIMGMWLVNELRRELGEDVDFNDIVHGAEQSCYDGLIDANSAAFLSPKSMSTAMREALTQAGHSLPTSTADYFRCAYRSLALSYGNAIDELERNTGKTYEKLYIVGGGAKNQFLNQLVREITGKTVIALPIEATALGNLKIQMEVD